MCEQKQGRGREVGTGERSVSDDNQRGHKIRGKKSKPGESKVLPVKPIRGDRRGWPCSLGTNKCSVSID